MGYFIFNLRQQGVNQKIMCYDSKDNNNSRFQPLIKLVYPSPAGPDYRNLRCQLSTIINQNIC